MFPLVFFLYVSFMIVSLYLRKVESVVFVDGHLDAIAKRVFSDGRSLEKRPRHERRGLAEEKGFDFWHFAHRVPHHAFAALTKGLRMQRASILLAN